MSKSQTQSPCLGKLRQMNGKTHPSQKEKPKNVLLDI